MRRYQKIMPLQTIERNTCGADCWHIGDFAEFPFAGPYTCARYVVTARRPADFGVIATFELVPGQLL